MQEAAEVVEGVAREVRRLHLLGARAKSLDKLLVAEYR